MILTDQDLLILRARRQEYEAKRLDADADSLATFLYRGVPNPIALAEGVSYADQWEEYIALRSQAAYERIRAQQERRAARGRQVFRGHPLDLARRGAA